MVSYCHLPQYHNFFFQNSISEMQITVLETDATKGVTTLLRTLWSKWSDTCALLILLVVTWAIGYCLFGEVVGFHSQLFSLTVS